MPALPGHTMREFLSGYVESERLAVGRSDGGARSLELQESARLLKMGECQLGQHCIRGGGAPSNQYISDPVLGPYGSWRAIRVCCRRETRRDTAMPIRSQRLPMRFEDWELLSYEPGWKYEYWGGCAHITPNHQTAVTVVP